MNSPRISWRTVLASTVICLAAHLNYLPGTGLVGNRTRDLAQTLCKQTEGCLSATARLGGTADRSQPVQYVTFEHRSPPTRNEIDKLRNLLVPTVSGPSGLQIEHRVDGAPVREAVPQPKRPVRGGQP